MTNDQHPVAPRVTLGDAVRTTVMAYESAVAKLDDRDQAYAIDLCRRFFGFMRTWAAVDTEEIEHQDREAVTVLRVLYEAVLELCRDRYDRHALSLALDVIVKAGHQYGVDLREPAGGDPAVYPEQSIVHDVAAQLITDHLQRMVTTSLPEHAIALLITRAGEVHRNDLVAQLLQGGPNSDSVARTRMLDQLAADLPVMRYDVLDEIRGRNAGRS